MPTYTDTNGVVYTYTAPSSGTTGTASITGFTGSATVLAPLNSFVVEAVTYSVTNIGGSAFAGCSVLTSITLPSSLTSIGSSAFAGCSVLTSITIPNSVTSIGNDAFAACYSVTSLTVNSYLAYLQYAINNIVNPDYGGQRNNDTPFSINFNYSGPIPDATCVSMSFLTSVTIGPNITSIGASAFQGCSGLTSIIIPNSVTNIGDSAFGRCLNLTSFTIPSSVTYIGNFVLSGCSLLTTLTVNSYLANFTNAMFNYNPDGGDINPSNLSINFNYSGAIPDAACIYMDSLTSVTIGPDITSIDNSAFQGCTGLTSITLPSSLTSIGGGAFQGCTGLTTIALPSSLTSIGDAVFSGCTGLTSLTIPSSVTIVGGGVIASCTTLTNLTLNSYLENLHDVINYLYYPINCTSLSINFNYSGPIPDATCVSMSFLTSVTIGPNITSIGASAFQGCSGLTSIVIPNSVTSIGDSAFSGTGITGSITLPSSLTSIGGYVFSGCSGITSLTVNSYLENLPNALFSGNPDVAGINTSSLYINFNYSGEIPDNSCLSMGFLTSVTIGPNITRIGSGAFSGTGLTSITLPSSLTSIGGGAFKSSGITSIVIPNSVTSIGDAVFSGCIGLTSLTLNSYLENLRYAINNIGNPNYGGQRNNDTPFSINFNYSGPIPDATCVNMSFLTSVTIGPNITSIGNNAFGGCTGITSIIIPNSVTNIGDSAFSGTGITGSITLPNSVTNIGASAFQGCSVLTSITIPNSVTSIGENAFQGCSGLTSITIPNSVTDIGNDAFAACYSVTSLTVNSYLAYLQYAINNIVNPDYGGQRNNDTPFSINFNYSGAIPDATCVNMSFLTSVTIGPNITSIGASAFQGCSGLTRGITIPNSVISIGSSAFAGCTNITKVSIPSSLTSINNNLFDTCANLTTVTIPSSVTNIDDSVFQYCSSMTTIYFLGTNIPTIGNNNSTDVISRTAYYLTNATNIERLPSISSASVGLTVMNNTTGFPASPTITSVSVSGRTATINFTQPTNTASAVTNYKYTYSNTSSTTGYPSYMTTDLSWTTGATSLTISNLYTGTYYFKLVANNDLDSNPSSPSNAVTVANFAPAAPTITDVSVSGTTATITFTPGTSNGSLAVTSYKYAYSTTSTGTYSFRTTSWTSGSKITISNLSTGTYYFKLKANNGIDSTETSASNSVTVVTVTAVNVEPATPTINSVSVSGTIATITFTPGTPPANSLDVTNYYYAYSTSLSGPYSNPFIQSSWTSGNQITVSSLPAGTYYFKLQAYNGLDSSESSASNAVTVNNAPATPSINSVTVSGTTATITFTPGTPPANSLAVNSYYYAYSTTISGTYSFLPSSWTTGDQTQIAISGLTFGSTYYFKLKANNGINSAESSASNAVTINNAPATPSINSVAVSGTISGTTTTINFTPGSPPANSLAVSSYYYAYSTSISGPYSFLQSSWTTGNQNQFSVSGLTVGSTYYFKLKANNGIDSAESSTSGQTVINYSPAAPRNVSVSVLNGIATILFTPGTANGSLDTSSYKYAVSTNGGAYSSFTNTNMSWSIGASSLTISGLTVGTTYYFKLKANNGLDSTESSVSNTITVQNFAPAAPSITGMTISGTTATITFTPNSNGSLAATSYKYAYSTTSSGTYSFTSSSWTSGNQNQIIVSNLPTGTYYFKLTANNGFDSIASSASSAVTIVPYSPVITSVSLSGTTATINFTQTANSMTDITGYKWASSTTSNGTYSSYTNTNLSWSSGSYSLIISGLTLGQTYYFMLKAYKNDLASEASNVSSGLFMNFAPATPQITSISGANGKATINFSQSSNSSAAITNYAYSTYTTITSNSVFKLFNPAQTSTPLIINGLTNGATYSFTIKAFNGIYSSSSNTVNVLINSSQPAPSISSATLKNGTATIVFTQRTNGTAPITNYAYSTDATVTASSVFTTLSPAKTSGPLTISGLSTSGSVSLTIRAINGATSFSNPSNTVRMIPDVAQPAPDIYTANVTAINGIATIPFSQTLNSTRGSDAIIKYVYCKDTTITGSSIFIDVPLYNGFTQISSPFYIPFTIDNPAISTSSSFTFKSYTVSGLYSSASTTATVSGLYPQPPPTIISVVGDGSGTAIVTLSQTSTYSYAPQITNYAFSTDGIKYVDFDPPQTSSPFMIYGLNNNPTYNFTFKSFNGCYSIASTPETNVLINYDPPAPPVIVGAGGSQGTAYVYFTQDTTDLTKDITDFAYRLNYRGPFINLNIDPSSTSFTVSGLSNGRNTIIMKSTNGAFSNASNIVTFYMYSLDGSTYVDPEDIV